MPDGRTLQLRRMSKATRKSKVFSIGEMIYDKDLKTLVANEGGSSGIPLARDNYKVVTAAALSANTNDWNPTDLEETGVLLVTVTAVCNLTGLQGGAGGREIEIRSAPASTHPLTIKHQDAASTAEYRFLTGSTLDVVLNANQSAFFRYHATTNRWVLASVKASTVAMNVAATQQHPEVQAAIDAINGRLPKVLTRSLTAPPGAPVRGDVHIPVATATGDWAGQEGKLATYSGSAWVFTTPAAGQYVLSEEDQSLMRYSGTAWESGSSTFSLKRDVSPAQLTAARTDNWAIAADKNVVKFSTDADTRQIGGMTNGSAGAIRFLQNTGTNKAVLLDEDANSTAGNRFTLGAAITLKPKEGAVFYYDGATSRWLLISRSYVVITDLPAEVVMSGHLVPAQITADQDNYAPTSASTASAFFLDLDAPRALSGIAGGRNGRLLSVFNTSAFALTLTDQSGSSTATNRFLFGSNVVLSQYQSALLRYDGTLGRWLLVSSTAGAAVADGAVSTNKIADDAVTPAKLDADTVVKQALLRARLGVGVHGSDIASSGTIDLQAATGDLVDVTGTTAITAITLSDGEVRTVRFTGALTLTHGASLVLPGAANITTAAGDFAIFRGYAAGVVRCVAYSPAAPAATAAEQEAATSLQKFVSPGMQHRHVSAAKFWVEFGFTSGNPTTLAAYNVSGYTDAGPGFTTISFSTAFSSANYAAIGQKVLSAVVNYAPRINGQTAGNIAVLSVNDANTAAEDMAMSWVGFGDQ